MSLTAFLTITDDCNLNCFYCFNNNTESISNKTGVLNLDNYKKLFQILKEQNFSNIILTGGEPLIHPKIFDIINLAFENNIHSVLLTNTQQINAENISKLKDSGLSNITISLSRLIDADASDYNELINYYEDKTTLIEKQFSDLTTTFLITARNFNSIHKIYKQFGNTNNRVIIFQPLYLNKNDTENFNKYSLSLLKDDDWRELKNQLSDWMIKYNTYTYIQLITDIMRNIEHNKTSCFMGSDSIVIDNYGNVFPCFHRKDLYAGNILKNDFKDILINCLHKSNALIDAQCISAKCLSLFLNYV